MENTIQSDLIRGHINTIILKALSDGDRYGYDIVREIEQKSSGQYKLKQPTLYSCLKRLEIQGFIRSYWGAKSNGGRRKYFTLTDMGRELFIKNQSEWEYSRTVIDRLISDKEVDLRSLQPLSTDNGESSFFSEETITADEDATLENDEAESDSEEEITEEAAEFEAESTNEDDPSTESFVQETQKESEDIQTEADSERENTPAPQENASQPVAYSDTTAIMDELFRRQTQAEKDTSYAERLISEKYVSDRSDSGLSSDMYFTDFFDAAETASTGTENFSQQTEQTVYAPAGPTAPVKPTPTALQFYDYHTSSVTPDPTDSVITREYRNILGDFLNPCFVNRTPSQEQTPPAEETQEEPASASEAIQETTSDDTTSYEDKLEKENDTTYTSDADVNRKFARLTGEVREMGDAVTIRTHNSNSSKEFSNTNYYFPNKLMLVHYGILFAVMLLEILFSAVFVNLVLHEGRRSDKWFYILGGVVAAIFPIVAFVRNVTNPEKQRRVNFNLKNSLIYRSIVMAQCFLIIYCLNIIAGMPLSFGIDYITTLLLPALLCTNFPVSALIFNALFKSEKFALTR